MSHGVRGNVSQLAGEVVVNYVLTPQHNGAPQVSALAALLLKRGWAEESPEQQAAFFAQARPAVRASLANSTPAPPHGTCTVPEFELS